MTERESPYLWSTTALTNGSADPNINFAEGQLPSSVNNSARSAMAAWARYLKDTNASITTAGSANAYTITLNTTKTAYASGFQVVFKASFSNTGAATLNVTNADASAIGAKAIRMFDVTGEIALPANAIRTNGLYYLIYDAAANSAAGGFILLNPSLTGGTVTSVAVTSAYGLTIGGSPITGSGTITAPVSLTSSSNILGSDVALNNTANYFDGPIVAQGTSGTWLAIGTVTCTDTAAAAAIIAKLWDGTTILSSSRVDVSAAGRYVNITLAGVITSPAASLKISVRDATATTGSIVFNASGNSKDSFLDVIRLA